MDAESAKLKTNVEEYLSNRLGGTAEITHMKSLSGGACQDNYLVDLAVKGGGEAGNYELVLRTDAGASLLASLGRREEYIVAAAAYNNGVKTPKPYWLEADASAIGRPFYFMERIGGNARGRYIVKDRGLNDVRKHLAADLAKNLAALHDIVPGKADDDLKSVLGDGSAAPAGSKQFAVSAVTDVRNLLAELPEAHPAIELCLNWCQANAPELDAPVFVHGDFRTGNFMVSPDGLQGIIDWEFAHWGDRHEDIAWLCMRDWRFGKTGKHVGGFADRPELYDAYETAAKERGNAVSVDPAKVRFWEIMGNVRWAVGSIQQAERHLSGADKGIELAAIGRRCCEMEYEAMRLIEDAE